MRLYSHDLCNVCDMLFRILSNEMAAYKKSAPSSSQPAGLSIPVPHDSCSSQSPKHHYPSSEQRISISFLVSHIIVKHHYVSFLEAQCSCVLSKHEIAAVRYKIMIRQSSSLTRNIKNSRTTKALSSKKQRRLLQKVIIECMQLCVGGFLT